MPTRKPSHSGPPLHYYRLRPRWAAGLASLFEALVAQGDQPFFGPHPLTAEHAATLAAYRGRDGYYVAVQEGRVVAYGMLRGRDEGYAVPSLGIAVHPAARGRGIATAFMQFLHREARRTGATRVRLRVHDANAAARRLYERCGYAFTERQDDVHTGYVEI